MKVKDEFRTNPLSHQPGGCTVRVTFKNGTHRDYDKVKKPMAFVRMQQSMGLMPWMATPEPDAELSIDKKFIMVLTTCEKTLANQYIETTSGIKLAKTDLNV